MCDLRAGHKIVEKDILTIDWVLTQKNTKGKVCANMRPSYTVDGSHAKVFTQIGQADLRGLRAPAKGEDPSLSDTEWNSKTEPGNPSPQVWLELVGEERRRLFSI
jgi:hypothetical protein